LSNENTFDEVKGNNNIRKILIIALDLSINALDLLINVIDLTIIAADLTFQTASLPFIRHLTIFLQVPHKHSCFRRDRFGLLTAPLISQ